MAGKILIAPQYESIDGPLIFLAGPIQGAPDWQSKAISYIPNLAPELHIASPRRKTYDDVNFVYAEQVDWERHYLRRAATEGAIMFWLAKEDKHRCDRAYAQTTRFELGECKNWHEQKGAKLVIGIEEGYTGAKYVGYVFPKDCPNVPICKTLEETCRRAIGLAMQNKA